MRKRDILKINSDGGSRGNPGPAAYGFVVSRNGKIVVKEKKYLGEKTNNFAEYKGLVEALKWVESKSLRSDQIIISLDSELITKQINGEYKVKSDLLRPLFEEAKKLIKKIDSEVIVKHVKRNKNKLADYLVNKALDEHSSK